MYTEFSFEEVFDENVEDFGPIVVSDNNNNIRITR